MLSCACLERNAPVRFVCCIMRVFARVDNVRVARFDNARVARLIDEAAPEYYDACVMHASMFIRCFYVFMKTTNQR